MGEFISFYSAFFCAPHTFTIYLCVDPLSLVFSLESIREFNVNKIHNLCALDETGSCVQSTHVRGAQAACHFHIKLLQIAEVDRLRGKKANDFEHSHSQLTNNGNWTTGTIKSDIFFTLFSLSIWPSLLRSRSLSFGSLFVYICEKYYPHNAISQ